MKKYFIILLLLCSQIAIAFPTITEINPTIDSLMKQVNIDSLESYIRYLQDLGPRPRVDTGEYAEAHQNNIAAKNWLYNQYTTIGNLDVYHNHFLPVELGDTVYSMAMNVVAVQVGTEYPDEYIIVCGHFDTYYSQYFNSEFNLQFRGPGADDNASGTAGAMEIARVLSPHSFKRSIIYLSTNGEESSGKAPMGSGLFAYYCRQNDINILGVFDLDMIGYNPIDMPLVLFYSTGYHYDSTDNKINISEDFEKYFGEVANLYITDIPVIQSPSAGAGDNTMFIIQDYPAMYLGDALGLAYSTDYYMNPCYHRLCDTIGIGKEDAGVNSMELVKAYTQATLAAIAELAELSEISIKEYAHMNCIINPNPANETASLTLHFNDAGFLSVTLNNILGQEVMELHNAFLDTKIFVKTFSLSDLAKGMYYLKIIHNGNVRVEKIIKN